MSSIVGTSGADDLIGTGADDSIDGSSGNDTLRGGGGNDDIDGGSGSDVARFSGNLADYDFSYEFFSTYIRDRVAGRDGLDELINVEFFQFADQTISGLPVRPSLSLSIVGSVAGVPGSPTPAYVGLDEGSYNLSSGPMPVRQVTFTASLSSPATSTTRINWQVLNFDTDPADFGAGTIPSGQVTFAPGEISKQFDIFVGSDLLVESDELFRVIVTGAELNVGTPGQVLAIPIGGQIETWVEILNDDTQYRITPGTASQTEGSGLGTFFSYSLLFDSGYDPGFVTMDWRVVPSDLLGGVTSDPTRTVNGQDFVGGVLPFGQATMGGSSSAWAIGFGVNGDLTPEFNESFVIELSNGRLSGNSSIPFYFTVASPPGGFLGTNIGAVGMVVNDDSTFTITPATLAQREGTGANSVYSYTVNRPSQLSGALTVNWIVAAVATNSANAQDFVGSVLPSGTLSFAAGQNQAEIRFMVLGDRTIESDELFQVRLVNDIPPTDYNSPTQVPPAATTIDVFADGIILNDDVPLPLAVSITGQSANRAEGNSGSRDDTFTVTRTGDPLPAITVSWSVQAAGIGSVVDAADFPGGVLPSGAIVIPGNQTSATISVPIQGDLLTESDDTYLVILGTATSSDREPVSSGLGASATILNDDSTFLISADSAAKLEGSGINSEWSFTVSRSALPIGSASVDWAVDFRQADSGDFVGPTSGTIVLADGESTRRLQVTVLGDTLYEPDESFAIALSRASAADGVTAMPVGVPASATIQNDDTGSAMLSIALTSSGAPEGDSGSHDDIFTVTRSINLGFAVSVNWAVQPAGSGAERVNDADFRDGFLPQGVVSFAAGETTTRISVPIRGDTADESNERYEVVLSNPVSIDGPSAISTAVASGSIVNDDLRSFQITASTPEAQEGSPTENSLQFTVTRAGNIHTLGASLDWQVSGGTLSAFDFANGALPGGQLVFLPGQATRTFSVVLGEDSVPEPDERIGLSFSNALIGGQPASAQYEGTLPVVRDNDVEYQVIGETSSRVEGNSGVTSFGFLVTRSGTALEAVSLPWEIVTVTANASDFAGALRGTASFIAGQREAQIIVDVQADTLGEATEWFLLSVTAPGTASPLNSLGTIRDDDSAVVAEPELIGLAAADALWT
jgi:hypothetical protein